jgi:uncharacterized membrane protein YphA (DoxX/SURF4 family)
MSPTLRHRLLWSLRILLALVFLAAGSAKLAAVPQMVQVFDLLGFGQWFRIVTGLVEVGGAALLLAPRTGFVGGLLLAATMVCATAAHLLVLPGSPLPAMVLALLSGVVAWQLRPARGVMPVAAPAGVAR